MDLDNIDKGFSEAITLCVYYLQECPERFKLLPFHQYAHNRFDRHEIIDLTTDMRSFARWIERVQYNPYYQLVTITYT